MIFDENINKGGSFCLIEYLHLFSHKDDKDHKDHLEWLPEDLLYAIVV